MFGRTLDIRTALFILGALLALVSSAALTPSQARASEPLFQFHPEPPPPPPGAPPPTVPPPTGYWNGPCGLEVDSAGNFYVADHYHDRVHIYSGTADYGNPEASGATGFITQLFDHDPLTGPCYLALDSTGDLYVGAYHGAVKKFSPSAYPPGSGTSYTSQGVIDPGPATGIAVDPASDDLYVNRRDHVAVYDSDGDPVLDGGEPLLIGEGSLGVAYGLAVSEFPATAGFVYVADESDGTVKVYDPAIDVDDPVQVIDPSGTATGAFTSLSDTSIAVDRVSGNVYVADVLGPEAAARPKALVRAFDPAGSDLGHLIFKVVDGQPTGLAVDNSVSGNPGRVYVTSGNTHHSGVYIYGPGSETSEDARAPSILSALLGGERLFPTIPIGSPAGLGAGMCEGDSCRLEPPDPEDPNLTTLHEGLGNPPVHYIRAPRDCRPLVRRARSLNVAAWRGGVKARRAARRGAIREAQRSRRQSVRLKRAARRALVSARRCVRANRRAAAEASSAQGMGSLSPFSSGSSEQESSSGQVSASGDGSGAAGFARGDGAAGVAGASVASINPPPPIPVGFTARALADGGEAAVLAGSTPYLLELGVGVDEPSELRSLTFDLPTGFLVNPAAVSNCPEAAFATSRTSTIGTYESGESCPLRSQVGVMRIETGQGGGEVRTFGLFNLAPTEGSAFRFGASPFGEPVVFEGRIRSDDEGSFAVRLVASDTPQALEARGISVGIWGAPWEATHNTLRGPCLNEAEPSFGLSKCSVGWPLQTLNRPLALLTLPTQCGDPLAFGSRAVSWGGETSSATEINRTEGGDPAPLVECDSLRFRSTFDLDPESRLTTDVASTASGFAFRLRNDDPNLADPRTRARSLIKRAVVRLPRGVTLNPSLFAGLEVCRPSELARETPFNRPGAGCPNESRIGDLRVRIPFYEGVLSGGIYLAQPNDPRTSRPGAENPFDSLGAVYLIAKSSDRGLLIRVPGEFRLDPRDGTLTAIFDRLPQLAYTDFEAIFRAGQRSALISPPSCGRDQIQTTLIPWATGLDEPTDYSRDLEIRSGIAGGPCPSGAPQFSPRVKAGGVNANVGSYTPYFIRLSRTDQDQHITSYSLDLPRGITGKLAGIPFCSEAAIRRARTRMGFDERRNPSCPAASRVGRTVTGYGVGSALTYAPGRIYLAGPYQGEPLSLVTINAATVGPFDLGTIVVRSAFSLDPRTAKLEIEEGASDPIPHILEGVPLHLREIRITMDRFEFTRNPTSCKASQMASELTGSAAAFGSSARARARVRDHFQLLNCRDLGFRPRLGLDLIGGVRRGAHPSLRATFQARGPRDANLKDITVSMPHSLFLAQNHIRGVCTRAQFAAERCPADSIYGWAQGHSPLFDQPLTGPVYLRSSDFRLPALVASLRSGSIRIVLEGRIGPSDRGGIMTSFDNLPDAPLNRFVMRLAGGQRGLLVNSQNICASPPAASVRALGQNNRGAIFTTQLRGQCGAYERAKARRERAERLRERRRQAARQRAAARERAALRDRRARAKASAGTAARSEARSSAIARTSETARRGNVQVTVGGGISPRVLPRRGVRPIAVGVGAQMGTTDGEEPPQLRRLVIEMNRAGVIDPRGLPVCRSEEIHPATSAQAMEACGASLVGQGRLTARVSLQGQEPYDTRGRLLVFNGVANDRPALLGQIYAPRPFANSFVIPFTIRKVRRGRFGTALVAPLPRALGDWGNITEIEMSLKRLFRHQGRVRSYLSAGCPAPPNFNRVLFPLARTTFSFAGGTRLATTLVRRCVARG